MSTRIYLKTEALKEKARGKTVGGLKVHYDGDGLPYVMREGGTLRTPPAVEGLIDRITSVFTFTATPHRTLGKYAEKSAEAYVDKKHSDRLTVSMFGENLKDMFDLYCKIRAGSVQPVESWEVEQKTA